jgi:DNA polymerase III subunit delta'
MKDGKDSDSEALAPRANSDLIGHETAEARFLSAWRSGRLPHGWLITGPRGIGKATLAFRIARFVLAGGGEAQTAGLFGDTPADSLHLEPDHPVYRRVAAASHADLMTLQRTADREGRLRSVIVVDDVRAAGEFMRLTPSEGGWRVVVVDCADEMNQNAANALLKMLEEPPSRALLLLVCHAPGRLLPTIRSRCCRLPLKRLGDEAVNALLARLRPDLAGDDRLAIARLAEGSPGRALALADQDGLALYRDLVGLLAQLPRPPVAALHALGDRLARKGAEDQFRTATELTAWWIGRMARSGATGEVPAAIVPEESGSSAALLAAAGVDRWIEVWEKIRRLSDRTDRLNLDRKQVVLNMFHELGETARALPRGTER